jgi:hypothetical protein
MLKSKPNSLVYYVDFNFFKMRESKQFLDDQCLERRMDREQDNFCKPNLMSAWEFKLHEKTKSSEVIYRINCTEHARSSEVTGGAGSQRRRPIGRPGPLWPRIRRRRHCNVACLSFNSSFDRAAFAGALRCGRAVRCGVVPVAARNPGTAVGVGGDGCRLQPPDLLLVYGCQDGVFAS